MKVLVLNSGSSSLKYQLFDMTDESVLAKGLVERIGLEGSLLTHRPENKEKQVIYTDIPNHSVAIKLVLDALTDANYGVISSMKEIDAVGHRTVHGGSTFTKSTLINDKVIEEMEKLVAIAPLHNPPGILGIKACEQIMPGVPQVAVFDTAFHQTMPEASYIYGLPYELYEKYGIRRYGFHGTSHRYVSQRVAEIIGKPIEELKIITCHLGNGSSIAAIDGGKVMDTTMGFTPLEGLIMGTRSGNVDPAIIKFIMQNEHLTIDQVDELLNKKSGFLGISGVSSDLRNVEEAAAQGNPRAKLAIEMFNQRIVRFIGAFAAQMNGVDVIVFTAGIGENAIETREAVCAKLTFLGVDFDREANQVRGQEREITKPGSKVKIFVIPTNEELMIARDTAQLVK
ncbi:acetate/propionate family kinase [Candidatus Formimonas warabiya]|nr:acetate kinase [Candidatus Formimonas warabiya]